MLKNTPLIKKILSLFIVIFTLFSISAISSFVTSKSTENSIELSNQNIEKLEETYVNLVLIAKDIKFNAVQVQQWLTDISATRGLDGLNDGFDVADEFATKFKAAVAHAKEVATSADESTELLNLLTQMEEAFPPYYETGVRMATAYVEEGPSGGNVLMSDFDAVAEKISNLSNAFVEISINGLARYKEKINTFLEDAHTQAASSGMINVFISITTVIIFLLGAFYIHKNLRSMTSSFKETIDSVAQSISQSVEKLEGSAGQMASMVETTSTSITNVSDSTNTMTENVNTVAASGEELAATSSQITDQLNGTMKMVQEAVAEVVNADNISQELDKSAHSIGELIKLIQGIAEQTNLLALNAAIESARAGEAGRGFAVVADEVKKLAEQTGNATDDISEQIQCIQTVSEQVITALNSIKTAIESVEHNSSAISGAVQEQGTATADISSSMTIAAESTNKITADINNVESAASKAGESTSEVLEAATSFAEGAKELEVKVNDFLAKIG